MTTKHPSYPKPTIVQVTCEIGFVSEAEVKLQTGIIYPLFAGEFPEMQAVPTQLQFVVSQQPTMAPELLRSQNAGAFRFATSDGKRFVQVSSVNFVYQSNEVYPGWDVFRRKLLELWELYSTHIKSSTVTKIGLRYINRITHTEKLTRPSDWLQPTSDLPEALLSSQGHFLGRLETSPTPSDLRVVTVTGEPAGPDWPYGTTVMDIDRITTELNEPTAPKIAEALDVLHEDVWTTFDSAGTNSLKQLLSGKLK
ncbi:TIGR04255 family protein [Bradyrhizobium sp. LCT2]|uniref:TIGR04255 family protein n=1 Tax=Bradyrhizobium sp. LCT2 TaxID=2493093 RepID=UPI001374F7C2|nr:TIGR04255 family protein [Bradyrhizobium sp. LCT2]